jgi:hypothetical protein
VHVFIVLTQHEVVNLPSASSKKIKAVASSLTPQTDARLVCYICTPHINILWVLANLMKSPLTRGPMTSSHLLQSKQACVAVCLCLLRNVQLKEVVTVSGAEKVLTAEMPLEEQPEGSDTVWNEMDDT